MADKSRITVIIQADGTPVLVPNPPDGETARIIDRDSIEAEVLRRMVARVHDPEGAGLTTAHRS